MLTSLLSGVGALAAHTIAAVGPVRADTNAGTTSGEGDFSGIIGLGAFVVAVGGAVAVRTAAARLPFAVRRLILAAALPAFVLILLWAGGMRPGLSTEQAVLLTQLSALASLAAAGLIFVWRRVAAWLAIFGAVLGLLWVIARSGSWMVPGGPRETDPAVQALFVAVLGVFALASAALAGEPVTGGDHAAGTEPTDGTPSSLPSWTRYVLPASLPLAVGAYLGYAFAYADSYGGMSGLFGRIYAGVGIGLVVTVAVLIGLANLLRPGGKGRVGARFAFAAAGLVLAGALGGSTAVPVLGLGYGQPVVSVAPTRPPARAVVTLRLHDPNWVTSDTDGAGTCPFEDDGSVRFAFTDRAGRLAGKPMSAQVDLSLGTQPDTRAQLVLVVNTLAPSAVVQGAAIAASTGDGYITWAGQIALTEVAGDGTSGRADFADLPVTGGGVPGWPNRLSGQISWVCS